MPPSKCSVILATSRRIRGGIPTGTDEMQEKRWSWVRWANIGLAVVAAILLVYRGGRMYREGLLPAHGQGERRWIDDLSRP